MFKFNSLSACLDSVNNLALLHERKKEFILAEELYDKALQIKLMTMGEKHPKTLDAMNNLAKVYVSLKKFKEAEQLYLSCQAKSIEVLGESHPNTLRCTSNLNDLNMILNLL